jgi:filamentous hemagglutinin family protein
LGFNRAACAVSLFLFWLTLLIPESSQAQSIRPAADGTGTVVHRQGDRQDITGGTRSSDGQNLFHSFERFGLSAGEIANFRSSPEIVNILGRITGGDPSVINGLLQVTGGNSNLFLLNPAGIVFGTNARLDVPASFTATTANGIGFGDRWFNAIGSNDYAALIGNPDQFAFTMMQPGAIANFGDLAVGPEQSLTLLGGTVINTGTLSAPGGDITIAAVPGENLVRISQEGRLLSLELQSVAGADQVMGSGTPNSIPFVPLSLPELLTGGNLDGATNVAVNPDGTIRLLGTNQSIPVIPGTAIASGTLTTAPTPDTQHPTPQINVLGDRVALLAANLNASSPQNGGTVRIGGDYQGRGSVFNASRTFVSSDSVITADALGNGNGGRIIVWGNEATRFYGNLSVRGGVNGGNGGFAEVSGLEFLDFAGQADLSANWGQVGTLLLDPTNIQVIDGLDNPPDLLANDQFADPGIDNVITNGTINAAQANVVLQATNNITFSAPVNIATAGVGLTAQANNDIFVNAGITTNGGALSFSGNNIAFNAGITTNGGIFTASAIGSLTVNAGLTTANGALNFNANAIAINAGITTNNGGLTLGSNNDVAVNAALSTAAAPLSITANNDIFINAPLTTTNAPLTIAANSDGVGFGRVEVNQPLTSSGGAIAIRGDATGPTPASGILSSATGTMNSGGGTITLDGTSDNQAGVNLNGAVTSGGGAIAITSTSTATTPGAGTVIAGAVNSGGGNISVTASKPGAPDESLALFGSLNAGVGNITLTTDGLCLSTCGGSIAGTGNLLFQPLTVNRAIALGGAADSSPGALDLLAADLAILPDGFNSITIGRADGSGAIALTGNLRVNDPLTLQVPAATGSIDTAGFTITAPSVRAIAGNSVTFDGSANSGGSSFTSDTFSVSAGTIIFNDAGNTSSTFAINNFTLNARNSITFNDSNGVVNTFGVGNFTLTAPTIRLSDSIGLTGGNLTVNGDVNTPSGTVTFANTGPGTIAFTQPLTANVAFDTSGVVRLEQGFSGPNILFRNNPELQLAGQYLGNHTFSNVRINLIGDTLFGGPGSTSITFDTPLSINNHAVTIQSNDIWIQNILGTPGSSATFNGPVTTADDVTITADEINFANRVSGRGNLILQPATITQAIALGGVDSADPATLNLTQADLSQLQNGFDRIVIGNANGRGLMTLSGNVTFRDPVTLRSPFDIGSINTSGGSLVGVDNASFTLLASQNITTGPITTNGQPISIISNRGSLNTRGGTLTTSSVARGGLVDLSAAGAILVGDVVTGGDRVTNRAGDITIRSSRGNITVGDLRAPGLIQAGDVAIATDGDIRVATGQSIFAIGYGTGNGGTINLTSGNNLQVGANSRLNTFAEAGNGGNVTLSADNINTGNGIDASSNAEGGNGGQITLTSRAGINTSGGTLDASAVTGNGGAITLSAPRRIITADLLSTSSGSGTGGAIRLTSRSNVINTQLGTLNSSSNTGLGGAIALLASGNIQTGPLIFGSSAPGVGSGDFTVSSRTGLITLGAIASNGVDLNLGTSAERLNFQLLGDVNTGGGDVNLFPIRSFTLNSRISTGGGSFILTSPASLTLTAPILTSGGALTLRGTDISASALISSSNVNGRGGNMNLTATAGNIQVGSLSSSGTAGGGSINLSSESGNIRVDQANSSSSDGNGGGISFSALNGIAVGDLLSNAEGTGDGGDISLNSRAGSIDTRAGSLDSGAISGIGGAITLSALNTIMAGDLGSASPNGRGGSIALSVRNGAITTGNLDSSGQRGGSININANTSITTGAINSSGSVSDGGNVSLDPSGDVVVNYIDARGGPSGRGGNVTIRTQRFFRALQTFIDQGIGFSISTAGGAGGGTIEIQHGGNGATPFRVGGVSDNGTAGSITTGTSTLSANPPQSFQGSVRQGNISILTSEKCSPICVPQTDPNATPSSPSTPSSDPGVNTPTDSPIIPTPPAPDPGTDPSPAIDPVQVRDLDQVRSLLLDIQSVAKVRSALVYVTFAPADVSEQFGFSEQEAAATQQYERYFGSASSGSSGSALPFTPQTSDELELMIVTGSGDPIRRRVNISRSEVQNAAIRFRTLVASPLATRNNNYLTSAQQLYNWLIKPVEADLQAQHIQNLSFIMDPGLRSLPIAALHDGQRFLIEKYSVSLMPSISLIDTRYTDVRGLQVLAMGISQFPDRAPLPAVPLEIQTITPRLWSGESLLNENFTLANFRAQRQQGRFGIVHLATHAEFRPGQPSNSFIQLWDRQIQLDQLRQLGLNDPPVELLVLSACRTALGDEQAELGFAGLALQAGVQSALASLWYVSDEGTLAFMTEFYRQLHNTPIKAEALRRTQIAMLRGEVRLEGGELRGSRGDNIDLPPELIDRSTVNLSHPFFWSAFTLVGSPW